VIVLGFFVQGARGDGNGGRSTDASPPMGGGEQDAIDAAESAAD
jgi:hypothetical protein